MPLSRVTEAIDEIRRGNAIILVDDEDRENEGDFVVAAEKTTPDWVNFMAKNGRGLICLALTQERAHELDLGLMVSNNTSPYATAFPPSIEAREGVTTGISASDRAHTISTAVNPENNAEDIRKPGHVFPLIARPGGVLVRAGHTEGSVDLARLAGLRPAGVICEILNEDGSMARRGQLEEVAKIFRLKMVSIAELIAFRRVKEKLIRREVEVDMSLIYGDFRVMVYQSELDSAEHAVFVKGDCTTGEPPLVRMQSANVSMEVMSFMRRGFESPLAKALTTIEQEGRGAVVCIGSPKGEERMTDIIKQIESPMPADHGMSDRQLRNYGVGAQILVDLNIGRFRLLTNNPRRIVGLDGYDLEVIDTVPMSQPAKQANVRPLRGE
ncbi:3,4-dihydroxy-2-butanone-4-phosphate synthase [Myxococcota bacterium]|nr:3,4-dihydroxy-2-butanone-4-phosphate synthase [Myxococcota bacterium]